MIIINKDKKGEYVGGRLEKKSEEGKRGEERRECWKWEKSGLKRREKKECLGGGGGVRVKKVTVVKFDVRVLTVDFLCGDHMSDMREGVGPKCCSV